MSVICLVSSRLVFMSVVLFSTFFRCTPCLDKGSALDFCLGVEEKQKKEG